MDDNMTEAEKALNEAVERWAADEAPGSVLTEFVVVAASQSFDEDGSSTYSTSTLASNGNHVPTHRILGLLDHAASKYRAFVMSIEWGSDDDG